MMPTTSYRADVSRHMLQSNTHVPRVQRNMKQTYTHAHRNLLICSCAAAVAAACWVAHLFIRAQSRAPNARPTVRFKKSRAHSCTRKLTPSRYWIQIRAPALNVILFTYVRLRVSLHGSTQPEDVFYHEIKISFRY